MTVRRISIAEAVEKAERVDIFDRTDLKKRYDIWGITFEDPSQTANNFFIPFKYKNSKFYSSYLPEATETAEVGLLCCFVSS